MSQSGERVTYLFILLEFRQKNHFIGYFYWDFNKYCWIDKTNSVDDSFAFLSKGLKT